MAELESRFAPAEIEEKWLKFWAEKDCYRPVDDPNVTQGTPVAERAPYTIMIPPPNVTGILHMGHALNNTLQDILIRWRRMQGRNTLWLPGTDHASIATEVKVTKKLKDQGIDKREIGRDAFLKHAWDWTEEYGGAIIGQLKRMGASCDWTRERFTMDEQCSRAVRVAFKRLFDKGLIYRGKYLVNWSPESRTVVSNDEVEYKEKNGHLWSLRYPLTDGSGHVVVATTRPETMLGDTAVAVNPKDDRYKDLVGKTVTLPLINREIPIIADAYVDASFGSGCVKITPAHDPNDFDMGRRHDLPMINIMHEDASINANGGAYEGLDRFVARKKIIADLEELGLLEKIEDHKNNVGHHDRTGCVIEPYLSDQWFVKMKPLAEPALAAVREGRCKIQPKQYENMYYSWLEEVRDWPISRQLYWGHQIPIWYRKDDPSTMICWDGEGDPPEVQAEPNAWAREQDILDTWFSSALWPFSTLGWPDETPDMREFYPTDTLVTAHEILFFWVARMIMMGIECTGEPPFKDVYIHAMIFDLETKKKMSKSLGNIIDPLEMIEKYGADAMRFTLCAYAIAGRNIYLSEDRFSGYRNFMNKIWNASRFVFMNAKSLDAETYAAGVKDEELKLEDRWILSRLRSTIESVNGHLERFAFDAVGHDLYHFFWDDYCDWYVELTKARCDGEDARDREVAQITLLRVLEAAMRLTHPVAPFVTEEIWQMMRPQVGQTAETLMLAPYPTADEFPADAEAETAIARTQAIITSIRRLRAGVNIPPKEALDVYVAADDAAREFVAASATYITRSVPTTGVHIDGAIPEGGCYTIREQVEGESITVAIPLSEDARAAELQRLEKDIPKLEKGLAGVRGKLSNEKFVANADPSLVEKERKREQELARDLERAKEKQASLA